MVGIDNLIYPPSSCDLGDDTSLLHLFIMECPVKCGSPNCDHIIGKSVNGECRNLLDTAEYFSQSIGHLRPINFSCGKWVESNFAKNTLSIRKSSYRTIFQDIAVNDVALRSGRMRSDVLANHRKASVDVQLYSILKEGGSSGLAKHFFV